MAATSVSSALAQSPQKWVTSWTGSVQGPYPIGNPSAQPDLRFAFPSPEIGACDQSFRLIVRPDLWGRQVRLRFSNALGTRSVTFDGVFVGLQQGAAMLVAGSNQPVSFAGGRSTTIAPGLSVWSDAVSLPFVHEPAAPELLGRKLAVSFHVAGESGPMTWHAKALTTSYLTAPGAGAKGDAEDEQEFSFSTASWYFLDALDMMAPADASTIVALGDSITDGDGSTPDANRRWPDYLAQRLANPTCSVCLPTTFVVNAGISGNRLLRYGAGPSALARFDRDVLSTPGGRYVILLEGINDIGYDDETGVVVTVNDLIASYRQLIRRAHSKGLYIYGGTLTPFHASVYDPFAAPRPDHESLRQSVNGWIRTSGEFDAVIDFDATVRDPAAPVQLLAIYDSGDHIHPSDVGYQAMANAISLGLFGL